MSSRRLSRILGNPDRRSSGERDFISGSEDSVTERWGCTDCSAPVTACRLLDRWTRKRSQGRRAALSEASARLEKVINKFLFVLGVHRCILRRVAALVPPPQWTGMHPMPLDLHPSFLGGLHQWLDTFASGTSSPPTDRGHIVLTLFVESTRMELIGR